jgi:Zn-dependent peptidase ImmA (M78 family)
MDAMVRVEEINPRMLSWARENTGLAVKEAAKKLGLRDSAKATAAQKLRALEAGQRVLSHTLLPKAAATYHRPASAFYLPDPPRREERGEDFRAGASAVSARQNATLDALLREVRARQQMLREVLEDEEEARTLSFVGCAKIEDGVSAVAASIRSALGLTHESQKHAESPGRLFASLRIRAEELGVFVLLLGDVGSCHTDISEQIFRGFALADKVAPFVVINDNDAVAARAFTLVHELAHIWVGASGVSGPVRGLSDGVIERFCNDVASEILLPAEAVPDMRHLRDADDQGVLRETDSLATLWNVSQALVAYRFARNGWITPSAASRLFALFAERWRSERRRAKATRSPNDGGGPSYYVVRRHRLGTALLGIVRRALRGEAITHTKAARILGVSAASVEQLLQEPEMRPA